MEIRDFQYLIQHEKLPSLSNRNSSDLPTLSFEHTFRDMLLEKINEAQKLNQTQFQHKKPLYNNSISNPHTTSTGGTDQINTYISEAATKFGVDEKLIHSIIKMESNYNPTAKSRAGAQGLMQLMPQTASGLGVTNPFDSKQNIEAGTKYLNQMLNKYNGNVQLALAAYNAGPGNVDKHQGIPPFTETQNYVKNVLNHYRA